MAKIKIGNTREIELLDAIKNPSAINFKVGNKYAELTDDITKTNGSPLLKFSKNGNEYYIREIFTVPINEVVLQKDYNASGGSDFLIRASFSYTVPRKFTGTIKLSAKHTVQYSDRPGYSEITGDMGTIPSIALGQTKTLTKDVYDFLDTLNISVMYGRSETWDNDRGWGNIHIEIKLIGEIEP